MPSSQSQPQEFWPFFPLFFVGMWIFVNFVISQMGWRSFANRYPAQTRPTGSAYNSPSAWFGLLGSYRNVVRVIFTDAGVYFYVLFLFRAFHPPFLVPWESVKRVEKLDGFFGRKYSLGIDDPAGKIRLRLPGKIEQDLIRYYRKAV